MSTEPTSLLWGLPGRLAGEREWAIRKGKESDTSELRQFYAGQASAYADARRAVLQAIMAGPDLLPAVVEFLEEVARGPYADSDTDSLCRSVAARASALLVVLAQGDG